MKKITLLFIISLMFLVAFEVHTKSMNPLSHFMHLYESQFKSYTLTIQYGKQLTPKDLKNWRTLQTKAITIKQLHATERYGIIYLTANSKDDPTFLHLKNQERWYTKKLHLNPNDWKMAMQGELKSKHTIPIPGAILKDTYTDQDVTMTTYMSASLPRFKKLPINLQFALQHHNKSTTLTIGYPTIGVDL
jgi:hypothetical protein